MLTTVICSDWSDVGYDTIKVSKDVMEFISEERRIKFCLYSGQARVQSFGGWTQFSPIELKLMHEMSARIVKDSNKEATNV